MYYQRLLVQQVIHVRYVVNQNDQHKKNAILHSIVFHISSPPKVELGATLSDHLITVYHDWPAMIESRDS